MDYTLPPPDPRDAIKEKRVQRSIRMPVTLWNRLDQLAKESGAEVTALIEQAIRFYFTALEKHAPNNRKK